jgi:diaminopimelate epimerase
MNKKITEFTKIQAAGNDYVLVEACGAERDWSGLAKVMLDRHYGIGADGLLVMLPSDTADFKMRIFNADGSESNACGNGLRCMVRYYADRKAAESGAGEITVETMAGIRKASVSVTAGKITGIKTGMGAPAFGEKDIPAAITGDRERIIYIKSMLRYPLTVGEKELSLNLVSMGNPHAVYFSDESPKDFPLSRLGPEVERAAVFPEGVNLEVARITGRDSVEARVWERGVGETLACGSGACAIAVAARLLGCADNEVKVKLPGGTLEVEWDGEGEVFLTGPAEIVFTGEWLDGSAE